MGFTMDCANNAVAPEEGCPADGFWNSNPIAKNSGSNCKINGAVQIFDATKSSLQLTVHDSHLLSAQK